MGEWRVRPGDHEQWAGAAHHRLRRQRPDDPAHLEQAFLTTTSGLQVILLPQPIGSAATLEFQQLSRHIAVGEPEVFRVRAVDSLGNPATNYRGTVRFSASDSATGLPSDYAFTEADNGVKEFTVTFAAAGTRSLIVTDQANPSLAGSATVSVNNGVNADLPIYGARDAVHSPVSRILYTSIAQGKAIGSGAIEGACKEIGGRLKLNSARWRVRRAERFGALLCLEYADQTATYWRSRAA